MLLSTHRGAKRNRESGVFARWVLVVVIIVVGWYRHRVHHCFETFCEECVDELLVSGNSH